MAGSPRAGRPKKTYYLCFGEPEAGRPPRGGGPAPIGRATGHRYLPRPVVRDVGTRNGPSARRPRVEVRVELKPGVVDPEAESIQKALGLLGIPSVQRVGTARIYDLEFSGVSGAEAARLAREAVDRLLANPVIHRVTIRPAAD